MIQQSHAHAASTASAPAQPASPEVMNDPAVQSVGATRGRQADAGAVKVELLVVQDCPNEDVAAVRVRKALDDVGLSDTTVHVRVVRCQGEAERLGFTGSPTILVDGADPFREPGTQVGMACRVYPTPGGLAVVPDAAALQAALGKAAAVDDTAGGAP